MRFSDDEALEFLQRSSALEITRSDVGQLNARTEGWAAGLQMVGHILRGQSAERVRAFAREFSGNVRTIDGYLWEEVLGRQSQDVLDFVARISVLDRFNAELCDAVAVRNDSALMIRQLERDRLYVISLDDVGIWYRFHHLFADVLRERLVQQLGDDEVLQIHRRAAAWLEQNGQVRDAARHAVAAQDWDRAGRLLVQIATDLYALDRDWETFELLQGLPEQVFRQFPRLAFYLGFALINLGRMPEDLVPLQIAEEAWSGADDGANLGLVRIAQSLRCSILRQTQLAVELADQALVLLSDDLPRERALAHNLSGYAHMVNGDCFGAEIAFTAARIEGQRTPTCWVHYMEMAFSGGLLTQQGKLAEAAVLMRKVHALTAHSLSNNHQQSLYRLGEIYLELNLLQEADRVLQEADRVCDQALTPGWRGWICIAQTKVKWALGDVEAAFHHADRAIEFSSQSSLPQFARNARALQARFWMQSGQLTLARRWAESCDLEHGAPPIYPRQIEQLTFCRLWIGEGNVRHALETLDGIRDQALAKGRFGDLIEIDVLRALAFKSDGDQLSARSALEQALTQGEPEGHIRTFINEGEVIAPLLRHAAVHGRHKEFAKRLLDALDEAPGPTSAARATGPDALTERELEVLRLAAAGLANNDIGRRLFISGFTVKKHMSNIIGKLGATNRTQAVDQARKQNLL